MQKTLLLLSIALLVGCGDVHVPEAPSNTDSTIQIDSVMRPGTAPVVDVDCARSLCGCWEDRTLTYENTIVDESMGEPLQGITLTCSSDDEPVAVSDEEGNVGFEIETEFSPGCGYLRCKSFLFEDPSGRYEPVERTAHQRESVQMERIRED